MKLSYVTEQAPYGPGESFVLTEVEELLARGHDVTLTPFHGSTEVVHAAGEAMVHHTQRLSLRSMTMYWDAAASAIAHPWITGRALARVPHSGGVKPAVWNVIATVKGLALARFCRHNGIEHIHAHWATATATMAMVAAEVARIPWSFTAHRYDVVANNLLREKLRTAAFSRFISEATATLAEKVSGASLPAGAVVLHMGVVLPALPSREHVAEGVPVVLCPASFDLRKGHAHLLAALAQLVREGIACRLALAGAGPLESQLAKQALKLGVNDYIRWHGQMAHQDVLAMYQAGVVACVVLASVDQGDGLPEGIPVSLMEAMAAGVPVVATATGGIPELLKDGAGVLVAPEDPMAMACALRSVLQDAELPRRLSAAGRRRIEERFTVQRVAAELERRFKDGADPDRSAGRLTYLCLQNNHPGQASFTHVHEIISGLRLRGWRVQLFESEYGSSDAPSTTRRLVACLSVQLRAWRAVAGSDVVYIRSHVLALPTALVAKLLHRPVVHEINGPPAEMVLVRPWLRSLRRALVWASEVQLRWSDAIVCVTEELAAWVRSVGGEHAVVIPNGANVDVFRPGVPRPALQLPSRYAVFFGAFAPWQGIRTILAARQDDAWPTDVGLVFVGDGDERHLVDQAAARWSDVRSLGKLPQSELAAVLANATVGLSPQGTLGRRHLTGLFPLKVFETMAAGIPVIVSDVPGQAPMVADTGSGIIVPADDPSALALAVKTLVDEPERAREMGARGRVAVERLHSWDERAARTHDLLVNLKVCPGGVPAAQEAQSQ